MSSRRKDKKYIQRRTLARIAERERLLSGASSSDDRDPKSSDNASSDGRSQEGIPLKKRKRESDSAASKKPKTGIEDFEREGKTESPSEVLNFIPASLCLFFLSI